MENAKDTSLRDMLDLVSRTKGRESERDLKVRTKMDRGQKGEREEKNEKTIEWEINKSFNDSLIKE